MSVFRKMMRVDEIKIHDGRRPLHYERVKGIAESLGVIGQMHPIGVDEHGYLVWGGHRVEAAKICGWKTIEATVVDGDEDDLSLMEIDENLQNHPLDALQFSLAVARRKKIFERKHPETKQHVSGGCGNRTNDNLSLVQPTNFSKETAEKAGVSVKTVERAAAIGAGLSAAAVRVLAGSEMADNKAALAAIAAEPKAEQAAIARAAIKEGKAPSKNGKHPEPVDESLPEHLRPIAADVTLKNYVKALTDTVKEIKRIGNEIGGRFLVSGEIVDHLNQARNLIANGMFHCPCPRCDGKKSGCHACRKSGWLPKWALEEMEATA